MKTAQQHWLELAKAYILRERTHTCAYGHANCADVERGVCADELRQEIEECEGKHNGDSTCA